MILPHLPRWLYVLTGIRNTEQKITIPHGLRFWIERCDFLYRSAGPVTLGFYKTDPLLGDLKTP